VLRRISGLKKIEIRGDWTKLRNEELHNLYFSPNIRTIKKRRMGWASHVVRIGEMRLRYEFLFVVKSLRKRLLGKRRTRWGDNIKPVLVKKSCR
jgi:hypothetical protein